MVTIKGYKVFEPDWTCRGFKYEVGKIFTHKGNIEMCGKGFHFCQKASDCFNYYSFDSKNKVAEVEAVGLVETAGDKSVTDKIKVVREVAWAELLTIVNEGKDCTGLCNTGNCNTGNWNTGDRNTGNRNSGYCNTGALNKTNGCNGVFCNQEPTICIFNIQTDWTLRKFLNSKYYSAICSSDFPLTEWVDDKNQKENGINGRLVVNSYEDACRRWWDGMSAENKEIVKSIPNFNVDVFCDITGIEKDKI